MDLGTIADLATIGSFIVTLFIAGNVIKINSNINSNNTSSSSKSNQQSIKTRDNRNSDINQAGRDNK